MKAYSLDLRQRVVAAYEKGKSSIAEVAEQFNVGQTLVKKMLRQKREHGSLAPLAHGGGRQASLSDKEHRLLRQKVKEQSDISLAELQAHLAAKAGVTVSIPTIHRSLRASRLTHKKRTDSLGAQQSQARLVLAQGQSPLSQKAALY
jgi:transposase